MPGSGAIDPPGKLRSNKCKYRDRPGLRYSQNSGIEKKFRRQTFGTIPASGERLVPGRGRVAIHKFTGVVSVVTSLL